jgi:hypothetical protein
MVGELHELHRIGAGRIFQMRSRKGRGSASARHCEAQSSPSSELERNVPHRAPEADPPVGPATRPRDDANRLGRELFEGFDAPAAACSRARRLPGDNDRTPARSRPPCTLSRQGPRGSRRGRPLQLSAATRTMSRSRCRRRVLEPIIQHKDIAAVRQPLFSRAAIRSASTRNTGIVGVDLAMNEDLVGARIRASTDTGSQASARAVARRARRRTGVLPAPPTAMLPTLITGIGRRVSTGRTASYAIPRTAIAAR